MLKPLNLNLFSGLIIAIILLGVVSAAAVYTNAMTYRDLLLGFERQYMRQLVENEVSNILEEQAGIARSMGFDLQEGERFSAAFEAGDDSALGSVLNTFIGRTQGRNGLIDTVGVFVFDIDFQLRADSLGTAAGEGVSGLICPGLVESMRSRSGTERLKPLNELCLHEGRAQAATIVPVGGVSPSGFIQVVYDPVSGIRKLGERLMMNVQITDAGGEVIFSSPDWLDEIASNNLLSDHALQTTSGESAMDISVSRNADDLLVNIDRTNKRLLMIVAVALLLSVGLALLIVRYSVFRPLQTLSRQLRSRWARSVDSADDALGAEKNLPVSFHALGELYETLRDMAIRDPLTGTYNRALLEDRLSQLITEHRRNPGVAAILLIDMVRFKYVNDMLGHETGDLLLQKVVARIAHALRESDTLARLGGDEFVILLPDTEAAQAEQVAQKIIQSMSHDFEVRDHTMSASVSIGIALTPAHGNDVDELLRNADFAMYTAKESKLGYATYDPATTGRAAAERMNHDGMLDEDIRRHDLFLVYQPVIEFTTGNIHYLESLIRWRQPDGRILMPDRFIRAAEQSGLIKQLSEWVIDTACRELVSLQDVEPGLRTGINLSMHNLHDYSLMSYIEESLQRNKLDAGSLLIEITETGVMLDPDQVINTLEKLTAMGLKLSIDDFGTGHSSLMHLRRLPVHTLKVDKSFVIDMDLDEENASIVRATIDLAHSLGLTVTAEGVETRSVHDLLKGMRCDHYQGFYVGKPMTHAEVEDWLGNGRTTMFDATR